MILCDGDRGEVHHLPDLPGLPGADSSCVLLHDTRLVPVPASPLPELVGGPDLHCALPSSPVKPARSVRLVLPTLKVMVQRLPDWQLPAAQVLILA